MYSKDQSSDIPEFPNIEDKEFENWLMNESFGVFNLTEKGYIYTCYREKLYFHGTDKEVDWMIRMPKEIWTTKDYGRYIF